MIVYCQQYKNNHASLHLTKEEASIFPMSYEKIDEPFKCSINREQSLIIQKFGYLLLDDSLPVRIWEQ